MTTFVFTYTNDTIIHGVFSVTADSIEAAYASFDGMMEGTRPQIRSVSKQ